ncbi:MAG: asparagine synthetase B family protein, partial [[Mycobacterium] stephanolepidis]
FADPETPRAIDWAGALNNQYLQSNTQPSTANEVSTWYTGILQVKPGTVVEIDLTDGSIRETTYWELPAVSEQIGSRQSYIREFRRLLEESVRDCATADAELGLFLSGGVDSAVIAALAHTQTSLHTFSVRTPATVQNGDAYYARIVADKFGIPNHQADLSRVPEIDEWSNFLTLLENPMAGMEAYYKYELHRFAKELRPNLKGMLLGAAADEYYGGYTADYSQQTSWGTFLSVISEMFRNDAQIAQRAAWSTAEVSLIRPEETADLYRIYLSYEHAKLYQYNVWHEDRTAAGSGIEARVPFLDHRLIELAASLPVQLRRSLLWDKRIVREAASSVLPQEIAERTKTPFYYGPGESHAFNTVAELLEKDNRALIELALSTPDSQSHLHKRGIHYALDQYHKHPDSVNIEQVLSIVNLGVMSANLATESTYKPDMAKAPIEISDTADEPLPSSAVVGVNTYVLSADIKYLKNLVGDTCYLTHQGKLVYEIVSGSAWDKIFTQLATTGDNLTQAMEASSITPSEIYNELQDCISSGYLVSVSA